MQLVIVGSGHLFVPVCLNYYVKRNMRLDVLFNMCPLQFLMYLCVSSIQLSLLSVE